MAEPQIKDQRGWAPVDTGYLDNPKMLDVLDASGTATLMHLASILYCAQHFTDGHISPGVARRKVGATKEDDRLLIDAGLWHEAGHDCDECPQPAPNKVYVHDFLQHNRTAAQAKRVSERRSEAAKARWAKAKTDGAPPMQSALQDAVQPAMQNGDVCNAEREKESKREGGGSRRYPSRPRPPALAPSHTPIEKGSKARNDQAHEAEKFRNNALAKDMRYANWDRAFTNWLSRDWVKRTSAGLDPLKDW